MFWGIGTLLITNAYVVYLKINLLEGVDKKYLLLHYKFRKDIALFWINSDLYKEDMKVLTEALDEYPISRNKRKQIVLSSPISISALTSSAASDVKRSTALTDASLKTTGILQY